MQPLGHHLSVPLNCSTGSLGRHLVPSYSLLNIPEKKKSTIKIQRIETSKVVYVELWFNIPAKQNFSQVETS